MHLECTTPVSSGVKGGTEMLKKIGSGKNVVLFKYVLLVSFYFMIN